MRRILDFKRRASGMGLCAEYSKRWNRALSKKELMDIATDSNGVHFLADAMSFGWGGDVNPTYIREEFPEFINGRYQRRGAYTSRLYCGFHGKARADSTIMLFIDCQCSIEVPRNIFCSIIVAGKSDVTIVGEGKVNELTIYKGSSCRTEITPTQKTFRNESMWAR